MIRVLKACYSCEPTKMLEFFVVVKYMEKMVGAGAGAGTGAKFLTNWRRSRTKMDRLRNIGVGYHYIKVFIVKISLVIFSYILNKKAEWVSFS
jgi:hypothetical protein